MKSKFSVHILGGGHPYVDRCGDGKDDAYRVWLTKTLDSCVLLAVARLFVAWGGLPGREDALKFTNRKHTRSKELLQTG